MEKLCNAIHTEKATQNQLILVRKLASKHYKVFIRQSRLSKAGASYLIEYLLNKTKEKPEFMDYFLIPKNKFKKRVDK